MELRQTLNRALEIFGYPGLKDSDEWKRIGSGAWHDAYRVMIADIEPLVIRFRKLFALLSTLFTTLNQAPRYLRHRFDRHAEVLGCLSDGYAEAYSDQDPDMLSVPAMAEWLWALDFASECCGHLRSRLDTEVRLRRGNKPAIRRALEMALNRLDEIDW